MNIVVIDNYDSFTFNLVQYFQEVLQHKVPVFRNDAISLEALEAYDVIVLSPGPGIPSEAGIMPALLERYAPTKTIFGVCLGHQAIGEAFGAKVINLSQVYHGVATEVSHSGIDEVLFHGVESPFQAGRYHSWVIESSSIPEALQVTATAKDGSIMAVRHQQYDVRGVQFHPESILTPAGKQIIRNFLTHCLRKYKSSAVATSAIGS